MKRLVIPGGQISPHFQGNDFLSILNLGNTSRVSLFVFHQDRNDVGPYEIEVKGRRLCKISLSNLINPEALILDEPYSLIIETNQDIIVQFTKQEMTHSTISLCGGISYSQE